MENYISNKNYLALYLNTVGIKFASALVLSFVGVHFYVEGMTLPVILLYFGSEFILRAALSPLSGVITAKYGFKHTVIIANIFLAAYFVAVSAFEAYPVIGFGSFILHAIARGIYYPTKHYMQANFVHDSNRGKFLTLEIVIAGLTGALAILLATYSVTVWGVFWPVALVAGLFLLTSSLSILLVLGTLDHEHSFKYMDVFRHCKSAIFRKDLLGFLGFGINVAFNNVVVALLVFFVVDSLKLFGIITATVFVLEMVITLVYGHFIDKDRLRSNKIASFLQFGSYASFLLATTPLLVALIKTLYNVVWDIFDSSFTARFHAKISRQGLLYACAKEVSMSVAAGLGCLLLAAVAYFWESAVFEVSLVLSAIGVAIAWTQFKD